MDKIKPDYDLERIIQLTSYLEDHIKQMHEQINLLQNRQKTQFRMKPPISESKEEHVELLQKNPCVKQFIDSFINAIPELVNNYEIDGFIDKKDVDGFLKETKRKLMQAINSEIDQQYEMTKLYISQFSSVASTMRSDFDTAMRLFRQDLSAYKMSLTGQKSLISDTSSKIGIITPFGLASNPSKRMSYRSRTNTMKMKPLPPVFPLKEHYRSVFL